MLVVVCAIGAACSGPFGPIPGGRLEGFPAPVPSSWDFTSEIETVALETLPADPHSVNVWCLGIGDRLYIPSSMVLGPTDPSERRWVQNVRLDPDVRVRIAGQIYELRAERVSDPEELVRVRAKLLEKYEMEPTRDGRDQTGWIFRFAARPDR